MRRVSRWMGMLSLEFLGAVLFLSVWQPPTVSPLTALPRQAREVSRAPIVSPAPQPVVFPLGVQPQHSFWSHAEYR